MSQFDDNRDGVGKRSAPAADMPPTGTGQAGGKVNGASAVSEATASSHSNSTGGSGVSPARRRRNRNRNRRWRANRANRFNRSNNANRAVRGRGYSAGYSLRKGNNYRHSYNSPQDDYDYEDQDHDYGHHRHQHHHHHDHDYDHHHNQDHDDEEVEEEEDHHLNERHNRTDDEQHGNSNEPHQPHSNGTAAAAVDSSRDSVYKSTQSAVRRSRNSDVPEVMKPKGNSIGSHGPRRRSRHRSAPHDGHRSVNWSPGRRNHTAQQQQQQSHLVLTDAQFNVLADRLVDRLEDNIGERLIDELSETLVERLASRLADHLNETVLADRLSERILNAAATDDGHAQHSPSPPPPPPPVKQSQPKSVLNQHNCNLANSDSSIAKQLMEQKQPSVRQYCTKYMASKGHYPNSPLPLVQQAPSVQTFKSALDTSQGEPSPRVPSGTGSLSNLNGPNNTAGMQANRLQKMMQVKSLQKAGKGPSNGPKSYSMAPSWRSEPLAKKP